MNTKKTPTLLVGVLALALALGGCATQPTADPRAADIQLADSLVMNDAWVKAAESGMSAAFGVLVNEGDQDVTVVSAMTEGSSMIELHETVENEAGEMIMREIDGGFVISAGDSLELAPGGNHIMLMGLAAPLVAGNEVTFVLTLSDGSTFEFTAPVKDFEGANENYQGDDMGMGGNN